MRGEHTTQTVALEIFCPDLSIDTALGACFFPVGDKISVEIRPRDCVIVDAVPVVGVTIGMSST